VRTVPGARLLIAGGGPLLDPLRRRAAAAGLGDRVAFTGYVPEADKAAHFNLADVFAFPSALEGFGLAVGEAMSSGLSVVASDRGSIPELLVDGEGGFLCDPARPAGFTEALVRLLRDPALRAKQGAANAERVDRRFRWSRCVAATRREYESVLAAWRQRGRSAR
jgi:glycosyltransferase involved in cell wall biosynthesis